MSTTEATPQTLRILVTIPQNEYQFKYKLISSLVQDVQRRNEAFQDIELQITPHPVDDQDINRYGHHHVAVASAQPFFSIIVEGGNGGVVCKDKTMHIPVEFIPLLSTKSSQCVHIGVAIMFGIDMKTFPTLN